MHRRLPALLVPPSSNGREESHRDLEVDAQFRPLGRGCGPKLRYKIRYSIFQYSRLHGVLLGMVSSTSASRAIF